MSSCTCQNTFYRCSPMLRYSLHPMFYSTSSPSLWCLYGWWCVHKIYLRWKMLVNKHIYRAIQKNTAEDLDIPKNYNKHELGKFARWSCKWVGKQWCSHWNVTVQDNVPYKIDFTYGDITESRQIYMLKIMYMLIFFLLMKLLEK